MPVKRSSIIGVAAAAIRLLNILTPKQRKAVLYGYPDGEDSIAELTRCLSERGDLRTVLLVDRLECRPHGQPRNLLVRKRKSLRGFWHYLTSRYVFFTHGLYLSPRPPKSQLCVNVWHGMPFKRIGHMLGRTPPHSSRVIATSPFFAELVGQSFGKRTDEVLVTGIPRNDVMVRASSRSGEIKRALGLGQNRALPRLIVWLPTYRETVRGAIRSDGRCHSSIFGMDDMDVRRFEDFLEANDCVCIAKAHPMAADYADRLQSDRIKVWHDKDLRERGLSLYEMVGASDLLITDASSVYVDYLILDRPVVIAFPDVEAYAATRGFSVPRAEDYFAGPLVRTFDELLSGLGECLDADSYAARREQLAALFHERRDGKATERLIAAALPAKRLKTHAASRPGRALGVSGGNSTSIWGNRPWSVRVKRYLSQGFLTSSIAATWNCSGEPLLWGTASMWG